MKNVYHVGSGELTFYIIERIINENLKLELASEAKERIQKCRDYLDHKIAESEEPLYGITTGFGSLCSKNISPDELGTLQENLIKSHACSVGEEIRPVIVKLMMLLKAHALSLGHSGVQVITVQRILDFFNNDVMPIVYDRGSLGASGDLAPLANLFLPLIGVGDVYYKGKKREAISVLDEFGWEPVKLMSKEGLALLNGTQFMSANGVFAILKAFRLSKKADLIAALSSKLSMGVLILLWIVSSKFVRTGDKSRQAIISVNSWKAVKSLLNTKPMCKIRILSAASPKCMVQRKMPFVMSLLSC